jgi:hypothetical protein
MFKQSFLAILIIFSLFSCSQPEKIVHLSSQPPNLRELLSHIKSVPFWYTKDYNPTAKNDDEAIDSAYKAVIRMDTNVIVELVPVLTDTTLTAISNPCSGSFLTYGQLAFLLIDDIEPVPYALVTERQWDVLGVCSVLPNGFLEYINDNGLRFQEKYNTYFNSQQRQKLLHTLSKGKRMIY